MSDFTELILACEDRAEAEKIASALLGQKLVGCVKFLPVDSQYLWHGKIESAEEVMLLMESLAGNFDRVEAEVAKLHSYDTFILQQIPIKCLSKKAEVWLKEVIDVKD